MRSARAPRSCLLVVTLLASACAGGGRTDATGPDRPRSDRADVRHDTARGDGSVASDGSNRRDAVPVDPTLPAIDNYSGASSAHAADLVRAAIDGLGFAKGDPSAPNKDDRFFVGRRYLAWIDQTGFYGKVNGLWRLNGASGAALDFVLRDPDGRPVSALVVAEDGDGRWPAGYPGAEHIEFPSRTPEANDSPACGKSDWCNQYGLAEAAPITNPAIPWWSACNGAKPSWSATRLPAVEQSTSGGLKLVYEGPLVKVADGDGTHDGDACGQDYLFEDGQRRAVFLRVGYELLGDADHLDRTMQIRNPQGNPSFAGAMSLIGGFVATRWPDAHYRKRLDRYLRPEAKDVVDAMHGVTLKAGQWNAHLFAPSSTKDEIFAWLDQPLSLSAGAAYVEGRSVTLAHVGPSDNADVGICLCAVHGGLELGGGLIHAGVSLPVAGGASTIEARRRLTLPGTGGAGAAQSFVYEAEKDLQHKVGRADGDGWSASTKDDAADHLAYGPYATTWGGGTAQAVFWLMVDNTTADSGVVVTLDVHDATTLQVLAARPVRRGELRAPMTYQRFAVNVDLSGRAGHQLETRVNWHDISYVRLDKVVVFTAP